MRSDSTFHNIYTGLLSLAPLLLLTNTALQGIAIGLLISMTLISASLIIYPLRNLIVPAYRIIILLILNSTLIIVFSNLLAANAYSLLIDIGVLFPLIAINALILSRVDITFSEHQLQAVLKQSVQLATAIFVIFFLFGAAREFITELVIFGDVAIYTGISFSGLALFSPESSGIDIFNTSAGALFLLAFFYAGMRMMNKPYFAVEKEQLEQG